MLHLLRAFAHKHYLLTLLLRLDNVQEGILDVIFLNGNLDRVDCGLLVDDSSRSHLRCRFLLSVHRYVLHLRWLPSPHFCNTFQARTVEIQTFVIGLQIRH